MMQYSFHQRFLYRDDGPNDVDSDIDGDGLSNDIDWDDDNDGLNDLYDPDDGNCGLVDMTEPMHSQLHTTL